MDLPIIEEPKDIKSFIKSVRAGLGGSPDIDWDSLAVWSFNKLPKYLWENWKNELKKNGITWQKFLTILRFHTSDIVDWALYDKLTWKELIERISSTIERYSRLLAEAR